MTDTELKALLIEQWGIMASFATMTEDQRYQSFVRFDRKLRRAGILPPVSYPIPEERAGP